MHRFTRRDDQRARRSPTTRSVLLATGVLVVAISPFAVAATGDVLREGVRNGTATAETEFISNIASSTGIKGGYSTRQSNLSSSGGGAIYGCRSGAGGSTATPPQNPCVRANNLSTGFAFEFNATNGTTGGSITVGSGGDTKKPFTTNATGVATGLNADRVDGQDAAQIVTTARAKTGLDADTVDGKDSTDLVAKNELLWALVDGDVGSATVVRGRGATGASSPGTGRYVVTFDKDISACAVTAALADATGTAGSPGEISADQPAGTSVEINTYDSTGAAANTAATNGFSVQVTC